MKAYFVAGIAEERVILLTSRFFEAKEHAELFVTSVAEGWHPFILEGEVDPGLATPYYLQGKRVREL